MPKSQIETIPSPNGLSQQMEFELALEFTRIVEEAAIESAKTMGMGDRPKSDQVATEAMRRAMDSVPMRGTIVIGEGERDQAPMLYIGEKVGAKMPDSVALPEVDIAVDPLEGTNLCATGAPNSITVLAASERGGLLPAVSDEVRTYLKPYHAALARRADARRSQPWTLFRTELLQGPLSDEELARHPLLVLYRTRGSRPREDDLL